MEEIACAVYKYLDIPSLVKDDLHVLRKETFKDRLDWKVKVVGDQEIDEYDNHDTVYLVLSCKNVTVGGVRLINTTRPYMVQGPFKSFFKKEGPVERSVVESSRFFVDKKRVRDLNLSGMSVAAMLLFYMHDYGVKNGLDSIVTVVSHSMSRIIKMNGWNFFKIDSGEASPGEVVHLLSLPISVENKSNLSRAISGRRVYG
jgi:acyl homoserine lactone synthase